MSLPHGDGLGRSQGAVRSADRRRARRPHRRGDRLRPAHDRRGNDIGKLTAIARAMVCECGMSEKLGPLAYGSRRRSASSSAATTASARKDYSEQTAREIDQEVRAHRRSGSTRRCKTLLDEQAREARGARRRRSSSARRSTPRSSSRPRGTRAPEARARRHPDLRREGQGEEREAPRREHLRRPAEARSGLDASANDSSAHRHGPRLWREFRP